MSFTCLGLDIRVSYWYWSQYRECHVITVIYKTVMFGIKLYQTKGCNEEQTNTETKAMLGTRHRTNTNKTRHICFINNVWMR